MTKRTITLTDQRPVVINEDEWPVIAHGTYRDYDDQYEFQANRKWRVDIRVRQHADGRAIVYGVYDYTSAWQNERNFTAKGGVLIDKDADVVAAIRRVGSSIDQIATEAGHAFGAHISAAVRDCVEDLPAQTL